MQQEQTPSPYCDRSFQRPLSALFLFSGPQSSVALIEAGPIPIGKVWETGRIHA